MEEIVHKIARGFADLTVADEAKQTAQRHLTQWLTAATFASYQPQLTWLVEQENWSLLLDSFYRVIPFGTGGRRGAVGIGTNRFNTWTLASSVQGHALYLRERYPQQDIAVVIAYDVREFRDLRGHYHPQLPNPLLGMTSRDFAQVAAGVYVANGIRVYMLPEQTTTYISTPELSYSIRALQATAGLNISASHNHPDDNGGKFYNDRGGQEVPPHDEAMAAYVERVTQVDTLNFAAARATGKITWIDPGIHQQYIALNRRQSLHATARQARLVFTPLHGTAYTTVGVVLREAGFEVWPVVAQSTPDGMFPTVPYRAPNPEVPESMQLGIELASELEADAVLACDPDADRLGVCSRTPEGTYRFLTGNEIAVLVTHYKLEQLQRLGRLPARPCVIKTEVTTNLLRPITDAFAGVLIGDLLVGFKYHADVLEQLQRSGRFGTIQATMQDFIIGVEESHGILVTSEIRDKDAAGAALLLAELASLQRQRGATLVEYLDDIYARYGYYANLGTSMVMTGAEGTANIQTIQQTLRQCPPTRLAEWNVTHVIDHWNEAGRYGPFRSETDRASRNVLVCTLENGARVIIRPSGTEPKNKIYIEVPTPPLGARAGRDALAHQKAEADAAAQRIADDFTRQMLAIIGVQLPDYGLRISGLVALDKRLDFVERFIPGLTTQCQEWIQGSRTREEVSQWIDTHLDSYGKDARGLVREAMTAYVQTPRQHVEALGTGKAAEQRRGLDAMAAVFFNTAYTVQHHAA